jgi:hypothetical protein
VYSLPIYIDYCLYSVIFLLHAGAGKSSLVTAPLWALTGDLLTRSEVCVCVCNTQREVSVLEHKSPLCVCVYVTHRGSFTVSQLKPHLACLCACLTNRGSITVLHITVLQLKFPLVCVCVGAVMQPCHSQVAPLSPKTCCCLEVALAFCTYRLGWYGPAASQSALIPSLETAVLKLKQYVTPLTIRTIGFYCMLERESKRKEKASMSSTSPTSWL